jgi:hypothetical protein
MTNNMKTPIEYIIVAVPFHADAATHDELARKVNEKLNAGYELYGSPFLSEEMMYQAMTKPILQTSPLPAHAAVSCSPTGGIIMPANGRRSTSSWSGPRWRNGMT